MSSQDDFTRAQHEEQEAQRLRQQASDIMTNAQQEAQGLQNQADTHMHEADRLRQQAQAEAKREQEELERQRNEAKHKDLGDYAQDVIKRGLF